MRLAQAARKLSITTEDIVDFLEIRGIVIEKDSNTKLDEKAVEVLFKYFEVEEENDEEELKDKEPETIEEVEHQTLQEKQEENLSESEESKGEEAKEEVHVEPEEEVEQREIGEPVAAEKSTEKSFKTVDQLLEEEDAEGDFVIKAPKVELKGLNVVGKIDLPEVKPKQQKVEDEEVQAKPKKSYSKATKQKSSRRKSKRELSPSEIRKRQEQREARRRERIEKEKKEKREQFYKENVLKPKQQEQKKRSKKNRKVVPKENTVQKPVPKTALGRFWRWLNT